MELHFSEIENQSEFQLYKVFDKKGVFIDTALFVKSRVSTGKPWLFRNEWVDFPKVKQSKNGDFLNLRFIFNNWVRLHPRKNVMNGLISMRSISVINDYGFKDAPSPVQMLINLTNRFNFFNLCGLDGFHSVKQAERV